MGVTCYPEWCQAPWLIGNHLPLPPQVHLDVILLTIWQIWKARNKLIFDQASSTASDILRHVINDMDFWSCRYKDKKNLLHTWRMYLAQLM
ncbi:hypothetical protein HU200_003243 [Digitaria exilis]|uniref:Uncharacterized protein n=1 Tax=Digitaria exilis TaxID=1010633 RepID=A0A835KT59_9POAL|nr:hypothetical protein HU200_003243 [Digitaria exilis]